MAVPEEIRAIKRPKNTIVEDSKSTGKKHYAVRERKSYKYIPGENPKPINGKVIGYIYNGKFISRDEMNNSNDESNCFLSYGSCALANNLSKDIFDDLCSSFTVSEAIQIMTVAILKVIKPSIKMKRYGSEYERTFVSKFYPGACLSKNIVSKLFEDVGKQNDSRIGFFEKRLNKLNKNHHIIIDGTLKENTSKVNDLSGFSYKQKIKGEEQINLLYAYDYETKEPLCCQVFPGNNLDCVNYHEFITTNNIKKGIIVNDKGYSISSIMDIIGENDDLHYISPLKKNTTTIEKFNLLDFDGILENTEKRILYKKSSTSNNIIKKEVIQKNSKGEEEKITIETNEFVGPFYYSFYDATIASVENIGAIDKYKKNKNFNLEKYNASKDKYGLIVIQSDLDLSAEEIYEAYQKRWQIEMFFKSYKSNLEFKTSNVVNDFSIMGSEFINFISSTITSRILKLAKEKGILSEMTYGDMMDDLSQAWRKYENLEKPKSYDKLWIHTLPSTLKLLERLEVIEGLNIEVKKRGRPSKKSS